MKLNLQDFLDLRRYITIAHHVQGRIRLKLDPRILTHPAARMLAGLSGSRPEAGLLGIRVNIPARSLIIEYDSNRIGQDDLEAFFTSTDNERVTALAEKVAALLGVQQQQG